MLTPAKYNGQKINYAQPKILGDRCLIQSDPFKVIYGKVKIETQEIFAVRKCPKGTVVDGIMRDGRFIVMAMPIVNLKKCFDTPITRVVDWATLWGLNFIPTLVINKNYPYAQGPDYDFENLKRLFYDGCIVKVANYKGWYEL